MFPVTRSADRRGRRWILALALVLAAAPAAAKEEARKVADGLLVSIEYTLTAKGEGTVDSNVGKDPLKYVQGSKQILPALEQALAGLAVGDTKHVDVAAKDAFGAYDDTRRITAEKSQLPEDANAGQILVTGEGVPVKLLEINDDKAVIDVNHPLAGKDVSFDVKILAIDDAPPPADVAVEAAPGAADAAAPAAPAAP